VAGFKDIVIEHYTDLISIVMVVVTLLCPVSVVSLGGGYSYLEGYYIDLMVIAVLWSYFPAPLHSNPMGIGVEGCGLVPLNPTILFITFPIWFLNILFAAQVIRYHTNDISRRSVMIVGYLSLIPPTILGLFGMFYVVQWMIFAYVGPIPIQFIVGYALVRFSHKIKTETESDPEWIDDDEEKVEKSWWRSQKGARDTSQEPTAPSFRNRIELILANLGAHPIRSVIVIGLFIVYLSIVYQMHLNVVAAKVNPSAGMYYWNLTGYSLFPIPIDCSWFFIEPSAAFMQLSPMDTFIYTYFYSSLFARVMWSIMWLTFGVLYIVSSLLKSKNKV